MAGKPTYEELEHRVKELEKESNKLKQAEEALRENEERFRTLAEVSPVGIFRTDAEGHCHYVNERWCEIAGLTFEEAFGTGWKQGLHPDDRDRVFEEWYQAAKQNLPFKSEYRFHNSKGLTTWVIGQAMEERGPSGATKGYIGTITDINERKQAEEDLEKEFRMRTSLLDNIPDCVALILKKGTREIVASNKLAREIGAIPGLTCFKTSATRDDSCPFCLAPTLWETDELQRLEVEYRGTWYEGIWAPLSEDLYVHYIYDITERKKAEETLSESELKYKTVTENSLAGVFIHQDDKYVFVNDKFAEMHGYKADELLGKPHYELIHPDQREAIKERVYRRLAGENVPKQYEIKRLKKNGDTVWHEIMVGAPTNYQGKPALLGHEIDITERKQAEGALRESEEQYRILIEAASQSGQAITMQQDRDGIEAVCIFANDAAVSLTGYSREELSEMSWMEIVHPLYRDTATDRYRRRMQGDEIAEMVPIQIIRKDGSEITIELSSVLTTFKGTKTLVTLSRNITDRKQAEEQLRESEEKYRQLFENERDAIMIFDVETRLFEDVNRWVLDLYGYKKSEFLKLKVEEISAEPKKTRKRIRELEDGTGLNVVPLRYHKKKDGTVFPVEITNGIFEIMGRKKIIGAVRDITDRVQAEERRHELETQLQQAHKMEAIGTLAGGIAHDFNNILSPIMIHSEMAMMALPPDSPIRNSLDQIFKAGERARDMIKQVLAFSRQRQQEKAPIKLSFILNEVLRLLRSSIPSTIVIRHSIKTEVDTVLADPTQIHQVLLNLCTNASYDMREKGGELEIELDDLNLDPETVSQFEGLNPGSYLRLTVKDTGHGIDPEIIDRIFDPYFTTKDVGEGTGMGLAVVHGIVKSHGGDITVESGLEKGTTFQVLFPKYEEDIPKVSEPVVLVQRGTEQILFVDDEKVAVDAIQPMLESLGYKIIARTSSIEALEAFRNNPQEFDLVISDMTMPNMTGKDLTKELMSIRSNIPIILCTGFSDQIDEHKAKAMGIRAFVMKPIVMGQIASTIREVLDKK